MKLTHFATNLASESTRRRTSKRRNVDSTTNVFERSNDLSITRSSYPLAKQIRSSRETVLAITKRTPRNARQVQEYAIEGELGAGSDRSNGEDGT